MKFPHFMASATIVLATLGAGAAQTSNKCQIVSVEATPYQVEAGEPVVFKAMLNTIVPTAKPEFQWQLSGGTIVAGEGTASITVDTAGLGGRTIDVTVSVSGISTTCSTSVTQSVAIFLEPPCGLAFDEFSDIDFEDEKARLDNFAVQLSTNKELHGSIIVFAGRQTYENEAKERLTRAKNYLVKVRSIDPNQVVTVDGGYRENFQGFLYIIPPGAEPPSLKADVSPTEIELTKHRRATRPRKPKEH
jgi:hypothetical protein